MRTRTPKKVLDELINAALGDRYYAYISDNRKAHGEVGELVLNQSQENRDLLKQLTSEDVTNVRPDVDEIKVLEREIGSGESWKKKNYHIK